MQSANKPNIVIMPNELENTTYPSDIFIELPEISFHQDVDRGKANCMLKKIITRMLSTSDTQPSTIRAKENIAFLEQGEKLLNQYWELIQGNSNHEEKLPNISLRLQLSIFAKISVIQQQYPKLHLGGQPAKENTDEFMVELMAFFYACYGEEPQSTGKADSKDGLLNGSKFFEWVMEIYARIYSHLDNGDTSKSAQQRREFWFPPTSDALIKRIAKAKRISALEKLSTGSSREFQIFHDSLPEYLESIYSEESFYTRFQNAPLFPYYVYKAGLIVHELR